MKTQELINVNIAGSEKLPSPQEVKALLPVSDKALELVLKSRRTIENILDSKDDRIFVVVGPCSIHDPKSAFEYAQKLKGLADQVADKIVIIMRVYFEKPRTTVGWKGLINDPFMDDSFHIEEGIKLARSLLIKFTELGLPCATEALDPISPQYLSELITWAAVGARTTESQTHREMASGLSMPVGFKNGTDGSLQTAVNAMKSSLQSHHFLGINQDGNICKFSTRGNLYGHIVLRGGGGKSNYDAASITQCEQLLTKEKLRSKIVIDCSHANSNKDYRLQSKVMANGMEQIKSGNRSICGFMIESHLVAGNQEISKDLSQLKYGVSVTDACVDWETTCEIIEGAHQILSQK